ncbi:MAG: FixH family protein [Betaproteobacteria bacterium]|nr:FixH family protein [Betaproteobacteria bacterium]
MTNAGEASRPWYREPWPWILMSGPAAVVVAGTVTAWIAFASSDGLVEDDYYKRGLAINQELRREQAAAARGIVVRVEVASKRLSLRLEGDAGQRPEALFVRLAHATRAGFDQRLRLAHRGGGSYDCELPPLAPGHWRMVVDDPRGEWRLAGEWPADGRPFALGGTAG